MLGLKGIKKQLDVLQKDINVVLKNNETILKRDPYEDCYKITTNIIKNQNKTFENLVNILCGKYEHGLFIMSNDGNMPTIIKDGKVITGNKISSFSVDWSHGEPITLSVDYIE